MYYHDEGILFRNVIFRTGVFDLDNDLFGSLFVIDTFLDHFKYSRSGNFCKKSYVILEKYIFFYIPIICSNWHFNCFNVEGIPLLFGLG